MGQSLLKKLPHKKELQLFIQRQLLVQKSPGKKEKQRRYWRGVPSIVLTISQAWEEPPQNVELSLVQQLSASPSSCRPAVLSSPFLPGAPW